VWDEPPTVTVNEPPPLLVVLPEIKVGYVLAVKLVAVLEDIADDEFCRKSFFIEIVGVVPPEDSIGSVAPTEVNLAFNCVCILLVTPSV
jgi:hypothetical protein